MAHQKTYQPFVLWTPNQRKDEELSISRIFSLSLSLFFLCILLFHRIFYFIFDLRFILLFSWWWLRISKLKWICYFHVFSWWIHINATEKSVCQKWFACICMRAYWRYFTRQRDNEGFLFTYSFYLRLLWFFYFSGFSFVFLIGLW